MNNICKLCVHSGIDVKAHPCNDCGDDFSMFKSDIEQQLAAAHRQGWEQCKREAARIAKQTDFPPSPKSYYTLGRADAAKAIASMEYKEAKDE